MAVQQARWPFRRSQAFHDARWRFAGRCFAADLKGQVVKVVVRFRLCRLLIGLESGKDIGGCR
ncbi:hypothetical protein NITHO_5160030 [Nitrolancea hollandica Lb]|uniref:Uncharacterized protein n=1 Tax=Nitrolancea hollandica Lb TaxID=1129897 RepID=I4ELM4_9BACT|nr:hypothetical protein NITHO_5160030 [Nitrolancea hollandica Lb]